MTDTLIELHPDDSGEIPALPGESIHRITAADRERLLGEDTRNLAHEMAGLPPRRRPEVDITSEFKLIEPPLGLSSGDLAPAQLERAVDITNPTGPATPPPVPPDGPVIPPRPAAAVTERLTLLGSLGAELPRVPFPPLRRAVPVAAMVELEPRGWWARLTYRGQHRAGAR